MDIIVVILYLLLAIGTLTVPMYVLSQKVDAKTNYRTRILRHRIFNFVFNFLVSITGISLAWIGYNMLSFEATLGAGLIGFGMGVMMFVTANKQPADKKRTGRKSGR